MTFQINGTPHFAIFPDPAAGRPPLLGMKAVGHVQSHDPLDPIRGGQQPPLRSLPHTMSAVRQTSPERFFQGVILRLRDRRRFEQCRRRSVIALRT